MLRYVNSAYSYLFYVNGVYVVKEHLLMIIDMNQMQIYMNILLIKLVWALGPLVLQFDSLWDFWKEFQRLVMCFPFQGTIFESSSVFIKQGRNVYENLFPRKD